jgi:hypothetical protein
MTTNGESKMERKMKSKKEGKKQKKNVKNMILLLTICTIYETSAIYRPILL